MQGFREVPLEKPFAYALIACNIAISSKSVGCGNVVRVFFSLGVPRLELKMYVGSALLSPRYIGRLTHRAEIQPHSIATVHTKVWVSRPGSFRLNDWTVDTQVHTSERTNIRHLRYVQGPPVDHLACFSVVDISHS